MVDGQKDDGRDMEEGPTPEEPAGGERGGPFADFQEFVEDMVESVRAFGPGIPGRSPRMEMGEAPDAYYLQLDLPGVERDAVEVTSVGDELIVKGRRARPEYPEGTVVRRTERSYGGFRRSLRLPADVDRDGIRARLAAGVLELRLPRRGGGEGRKVEID